MKYVKGSLCRYKGNVGFIHYTDPQIIAAEDRVIIDWQTVARTLAPEGAVSTYCEKTLRCAVIRYYDKNGDHIMMRSRHSILEIELPGPAKIWTEGEYKVERI